MPPRKAAPAKPNGRLLPEEGTPGLHNPFLDRRIPRAARPPPSDFVRLEIRPPGQNRFVPPAEPEVDPNTHFDIIAINRVNAEPGPSTYQPRRVIGLINDQAGPSSSVASTRRSSPRVNRNGGLGGASLLPGSHLRSRNGGGEVRSSTRRGGGGTVGQRGAPDQWEVPLNTIITYDPTSFLSLPGFVDPLIHPNMYMRVVAHIGASHALVVGVELVKAERKVLGTGRFEFIKIKDADVYALKLERRSPGTTPSTYTEYEMSCKLSQAVTKTSFVNGDDGPPFLPLFCWGELRVNSEKEASKPGVGRRHPQLNDSGLVGTLMNLATPFESVLSQPGLSDSYIHHLFTSAYHALVTLHKSGYVHRDIKPANLVVTKKNYRILSGDPWLEDLEDVVVLIDCGTAALAYSRWEEGGEAGGAPQLAAGTVSFMTLDILTRYVHDLAQDAFHRGILGKFWNESDFAEFMKILQPSCNDQILPYHDFWSLGVSFLQIMDSDYFESRVMQDQDLEPIISGLYGTGGGEPLNVEDIESLWISLAAKYSKLYDKRTYLRQYEGTIDKGLYGELLEILLVRPAVNSVLSNIEIEEADYQNRVLQGINSMGLVTPRKPPSSTPFSRPPNTTAFWFDALKMKAPNTPPSSPPVHAAPPPPVIQTPTSSPFRLLIAPAAASESPSRKRGRSQSDFNLPSNHAIAESSVASGDKANERRFTDRAEGMNMSEVDQERGMSAKARKVKKKQKTARPYREVEDVYVNGNFDPSAKIMSFRSPPDIDSSKRVQRHYRCGLYECMMTHTRQPFVASYTDFLQKFRKHLKGDVIAGRYGKRCKYFSGAREGDIVAVEFLDKDGNVEWSWDGVNLRDD